MHRMHVAALFALAGLVACTPPREPTGDATTARETPAEGVARRAASADAADMRAPLVAMDEQAPPAPPTTGGAPAEGGQWFLQESDPPRAVWGVPASEGMLTIACDRAGGQLMLERQAVGVAEDVRVLVLDADGVRVDYPAERRETELAPVLATRIALDAPIVDRLLGAQRLRVTAGSDAITATSPGSPVGAVVEACRREPQP